MQLKTLNGADKSVSHLMIYNAFIFFFLQLELIKFFFFTVGREQNLAQRPSTEDQFNHVTFTVLY